MAHSVALTSDLAPAQVSKRIKALIVEVGEARADASRLDELRRLFSRLEASGELKFGAPLPENKVAAKWRSFLLKYHKEMVDQLCARVSMGRHSAIRSMWGVIAASPLSSKKEVYKYVNSGMLLKFMRALVQQEISDMDRAMRHMLESEFFGAFRDVQFYALGCMAQMAQEAYDAQSTSSSSTTAQKLLDLLFMIQLPHSYDELENSQYLCPLAEGVHPDEINDTERSGSDDSSDSDSEEENENEATSQRPTKRQKTVVEKFAFQQLKCFRRENQKAWLAILKLQLPTASLKRALRYIPETVFGNVPSPLRFSDFFTQAYSDHGTGVIGVLALDGIFRLITEYELEYADFYKQLYRLVSPRVLYAKYRARFFSLLTNCLVRNEMLPAHLVAAFAKRLCRSALSGPPSGSLFVLALVSNLLRKHPECNCLLHRDIQEMSDPFLPQEDDPVECKALQSSLWELSAFERHYLPAIATLAKSIGSEEEAKAPPHDIEVFASHTYKSLFDQEKKKKMKPALTFTEPPSLFTKDDIFANFLQFGKQ